MKQSSYFVFVVHLYFFLFDLWPFHFGFRVLFDEFPFFSPGNYVIECYLASWRFWAQVAEVVNSDVGSYVGYILAEAKVDAIRVK
jgi:hypothetical protein